MLALVAKSACRSHDYRHRSTREKPPTKQNKTKKTDLSILKIQLVKEKIFFQCINKMTALENTHTNAFSPSDTHIQCYEISALCLPYREV